VEKDTHKINQASGTSSYLAPHRRSAQKKRAKKHRNLFYAVLCGASLQNTVCVCGLLVVAVEKIYLNVNAQKYAHRRRHNKRFKRRYLFIPHKL